MPRPRPPPPGRRYDQAKDDRATLDKTANTGENLLEVSLRLASRGSDFDYRPLVDPVHKLSDAANRHDSTATADAAETVADAAQKSLAGMKPSNNQQHKAGARDVRNGIARLRSGAEAAQKATSAKDVEARKADLDKAISAETDADKAVRPARDAYRDCLAKTTG